jgi:hypothetical protein
MVGEEFPYYEINMNILKYTTAVYRKYNWVNFNLSARTVKNSSLI